MQQRTAPAVESIIRYPHIQAVAAVQVGGRGAQDRIEIVILFIAICMLWGLVVATVVAEAMH